jgi:hypothetical protein
MSTISFYRDLGYPFDEAEMPAAPSHCRCGRPLIRVVERDGYLPDGTLSEVPVWCCPMTRGRWNRLLLRHVWPHREYAPDHFGHWYWRERQYR